MLESFGEATEDHVMRVGYPVLNEAFLDDANYKDINTTEERQKNIHEAVNQEKSRLWPKDETPKNKKHEPKTLLGSRIKATTDAPTRMIDRNVERQANETLKTFKGKGKAN